VAKDVGPEFKPQYCQKKKEKKKYVSDEYSVTNLIEYQSGDLNYVKC
jgi:hypothetical protein